MSNNSFCIIALPKNLNILIDQEDFERFKNYKITLADGYPAVGTGNSRIAIHRLICPAPVSLEVDHINGNKLDCRRKNLRVVTHNVNIQNTQKRVDSPWPYKGVRLIHCGWQGRITINNKRITKAGFGSAEEAAKWYNDMVDKHIPGGYKNELSK